MGKDTVGPAKNAREKRSAQGLFRFIRALPGAALRRAVGGALATAGARFVNIIIFRRRNLAPLRFSLRPLTLVAGAVVLAAGLAGNLFWAQALLHGGSLSSRQASVDLRVALEAQRSELAALRGQAESDSQAVGRHLAALQGQFLRLEALGAHLTEVAGLADGEFSFGEPAPVGGPENPVMTPAGPSGGFDFTTQLDELAARLDAREIELNVLDGVLAHQQLEEQRSPRRRPITAGWLSSNYGKRVDPITGQPAWHQGIDFAGRAGTPVVAVAGGVVTYAGRRTGYGMLVEIHHGDGYATRYGHHQALSVKVGEVVKKGQQIGLMGSSGRSTGPHVHFELLKNGKPQNPKAFLAGS